MRRIRPVLLAHCLRVPERTAELPLREPQLLGRRVHVLEVEQPRMGHERLESVRVAGDPVHHVSTVRTTGRPHARRIQPGSRSERRVQTVHEVRVDLPRPRLRHVVDELLPVARGAARVDNDDAGPGRGEHLVVPARVPAVEPRALWAAVNQEDDGIPLPFPVLWRLENEPMHAVAARTAEPEILGGVERELCNERVVQVRELLDARGARPIQRRCEHFGRPLRRVAKPRDRARITRERERDVVRVPDHDRRRSRRGAGRA